MTFLTPATDSKAYDLSGLSVLVVEDNTHGRTLMREVLRVLGVRHVIMADHGAHALKLLESTDPDIIIADWHMAPLNGLDLVEKIRTDPDAKNPYVPVIMVTAHTEYTRVKQAVDGGVNEFLAKPLSVAALYQRIVNVIERPRKFVRTKTFIGPDRRRRMAAESAHAGEMRRDSDNRGQGAAAV